MVNFPVCKDNVYKIDVEETKKLIDEYKPEFIVFGKSMVLHKEPVSEIAANDSNRLAAALMAANRTNSARQNDIYGPSRKEKATEAWGQDKIRRGERWNIIGDKVGDFVDKVLGTYQIASATAGNAALTRELAKEGMSSGAFDQLGRGVTATKNMVK